MSHIQKTFLRLKSALDTFQNALDAPKFQILRPTFETTKPSDLEDFLQRRDKSEGPSSNLTDKLACVKLVLDCTYNAGWKTFGFEEPTLRQLYSCLQCTLMAGHNIHKDMSKIVDILEQAGECIISGILEETEKQMSEPLWDCICRISEEITTLCTIYTSQGVTSAENRACSMTWNEIRALQNEYRATQSQKLIQIHVSQVKPKEINRWLSPPDPSSNFHAGLKERQVDTGLWLLRSSEFVRWNTTNESFLWLYGKPGCGKTVLASTVIENITTRTQPLSNQVVAYFFFTFRDKEKQRPQKMLLSIISQLFSQSSPGVGIQAIEELFSTCRNGARQPTANELMRVLQQLICGLNETFIILDALDECEDATGRKDRTGTLQCIQEILGWRLGTLHFMVTSRPEKEIEDFLQPLLNRETRIFIQSPLVEKDIRDYVQHRIRLDPELARWKKRPKIQEEIELKLMERVDGMFRWAECQLDALGSCLNLPMLRRALTSLPQDLDDTYARILRNIKPENRPYAVKVLQWLVLSARPLRIEELSEVLAIDTDPEARFDPENRFPDPRDVLNICSSLLTTVSVTHSVTGIGDVEVEELALAHFSVKEYLTSGRVCKDIEFFGIQTISGNKAIAEMCLAYLVHFDKPLEFSSEVLEEFPLADYAARYWFEHAKIVDREEHLPIQHAMMLFSSSGYCFRNWLCLFDPDRIQKPEIRRSEQVKNAGSPLYCASVLGICPLVAGLLEAGANVDTRGGMYDNALQAASARGHEAIVRLLLDNQANVNAQGGAYGTALQAASARGHEAIVRLLLDNQASVDAQGGLYSTALQAASAEGHVAIVRLLLGNQADVNAQGGAYGTALQVASARGYEAIVRLLLDNQASVNAQGGVYGTAVQAASARGHVAIVRLLLDIQASVNAQGEAYGTALQAASARGYEAIVRLLLDNQASVNAQGGIYGTALQAASAEGHEAIVRLLLDNQASVNAQGGVYGNALQAASRVGNEAIMRLLLQAGAKRH